MELYEKFAHAKTAGLIGTAARGALSVGKGLVMPFSGAGAKASLGQKALHAGASAYAIGAPIADSVAPSAKPPATAHIAGRTFGSGQRDNSGGMKSAALDERLSRLVKVALSIGPFSLQHPKDLIDIGSYGAMIGSKLLPHDHPWHTGLEAAGLIGLGSSVGADMLMDPGERKPGAKDLAGLALFGSALYDRWKREHGPGAPTH